MEYKVTIHEHANPNFEPTYAMLVQHSQTGSWISVYSTKTYEDMEKYVENWKRLGGESLATTIMEGNI